MTNSSKASTHSTNSGSKTMAELMAKHNSSFISLTRGQEVKGKITKIAGNEVLMDIDAKTEAMVLEKDRKLLKQLLHFLKVGDEVTATVITPESEMGYPLVSLRRFAENKTWDGLEKLRQSQEKIDVFIQESTKGGFLVESASGTSGFLPNSHVVSMTSPEEMVGKTIKASIVEINRENHRVIFSQKGMLTKEQFKSAVSSFKEGQKVSGTVSGITSFGLFVSLPTGKDEVPLDALIHVSEIAWEKVENLSALFSIGDTVDAIVIGFDIEAKRVNLSIKRMTKDPFALVVEAFPVDKKVTGKVVEISEQGVTLDLGEIDDVKVEGMIRKDKIPPTTTYEEGQAVSATVTQIDNRKRKVLLTPVLKEKPLMYR